MLRRHRQFQTKLHKLLDAALFGGAFWLAHWLRSLEVFDPAPHLIQDFQAYAWLLLVIALITPPLLVGPEQVFDFGTSDGTLTGKVLHQRPRPHI